MQKQKKTFCHTVYSTDSETDDIDILSTESSSAFLRNIRSASNFYSSDSFDSEDNIPLSQIKDTLKTEFQKFMPTPKKQQGSAVPRRKAINYKGTLVKKELFKKDVVKNLKKAQRK